MNKGKQVREILVFLGDQGELVAVGVAVAVALVGGGDEIGAAGLSSLGR
jgi:hypothetical protein